MIFLLKARNVRKIWAVILGMLTSGRKARNDALPCWTVNHMWEAKKRVLMWWRLTCGNEAVEFKTCHNIARVSRLLGRFNKKIKMHSGLKKKRCEGLEEQGTLANIMLVWSEFVFGILLMDSKWSSSSTSLSLSRILMLSLISPLEAGRWIYYRRKKTNSWKMILLCRARVPLLFQGGVAECFFLRVIFCSRREQMERERFSIKEYFNLLGGNYEYKAACECLAACSSWHSSVLITFRGCFICRYILLCKTASLSSPKLMKGVKFTLANCNMIYKGNCSPFIYHFSNSKVKWD